MTDSIQGAGQADAANRRVVLEFPLAIESCRVEPPDVEKINQYSVYELGKSLQRVSAYRGSAPPVAILGDLFSARAMMASLLNGPISLGVSKSLAQQVLKQLEDFVEFCTLQKDGEGRKKFRWPEPGDPAIEPWRLDWFRDQVEKFETVLSEEMQEATTYFVPRRGIYWTPALVEAADESFPADIRGHIPEKAKVDWRAAGRCLAFNLLTASGFHVARAVEGIMESYYQFFCGQPPGTTLKSWWDYIQEFDKVVNAGTQPAPTTKTISELKQMKDDYRNPIAHPRVV